MKILIVEDEFALADALRDRLTQENYDVDIASDGVSGCDRAMTGAYDIVIMDGMLPGKDGTEIIYEMRKAKVTTPVLMLTARSSLVDKLKGLDAGADDYMTKPFEVEELLARLRALIRRNYGSEDDVVRAGNLSLDRRNASLMNSDTRQTISLAGKEFKILEYFLENPGKALTREQISERIWGNADNVEYNNVEVYVSFIRKKIKFLKADVCIRAVRGVGYRLDVEAVNDKETTAKD
ncbi:response regulator transcription factor [Candidatus Weimeria sp. HCP3S3_B5]|uniref:response regulator transcription factor n=1 Tax=Candidatus Weimeria sp. HCP3S3_B5 TaxID=3438871 RepID=UPI003F8BE36B